MLTSLKPSWSPKPFEQNYQRVILPLRTSNLQNANPEKLKTPLNKPTMKSLQESRKTFLENLQNTTHSSSDQDDHRKKRKISFKTKNSSGANRRIAPSNTTTLSANKVQQLTTKFNKLMHEQPKMTKAIRKVNSIKVEQKKPLIRPKPSRIEDKKRPSVKRKASVKKIKEFANERPINHNESRNSVKDTIEIFERRKSIVEKPKVPEKNVCKTKELVIKDGVKIFKILSNEKAKSNLSELQNYFEGKTTNDELTTKTEDNIIDTSDIPLDLSPRKTPKSPSTKLYETLKITKTTSSTNLLKIVSAERLSQETVKPNNSFLWRSRSKDSSSFNIYTSIDYEDNTIEKKVECNEKIEYNDKMEYNKKMEYNDKQEHVYEDTGQTKDVTNGENDQKVHEIIENLYDTVDPQIMDEYKEKYEELLARTDEILKEYKTPKEMKISNKNDDSLQKDEGLQDNVSVHSYESFYNKTELDNCDKIEDIYEVLSVKNDPPKIKILQEPLPSLPDICTEYKDIGTVYNLHESESIYTTLPNTSLKTSPIKTAPKLEVTQASLPEEDIYSTVKDPYEKICNTSDKYLTYESSLPHNLGKFLPNTPPETLPIKTAPKLEVTQASTPEEDIYSTVKDPYEKICNTSDKYLSYESILPHNLGKGDDLSSCGSNRGSVLSCDQASNSLYGRYAPASDNSSSDRNSDDWVDISDIEEDIPGFVIIREKQKLNKKNSGWSNKVRDQWTKSPKKVVLSDEDAFSDTYHYYESLHSDDDFDSFDSESDDECFNKINPNDSGVEMGLSQLPDPPRDTNNPGGNIYGLTRLAARLRKNWSLTKNDISKSLSRMTKKKTILSNGASSGTSLPPPRPPPPLPTTRPAPPLPTKRNLPLSTLVVSKTDQELKSSQNVSQPYQNVEFQRHQQSEEVKTIKTSNSTNNIGRKTTKRLLPISTSVLSKTDQELRSSQNVSQPYQNTEFQRHQQPEDVKTIKTSTSTNSIGRKKNWLKFRRAVSMGETSSEDVPQLQVFNGSSQAKSTFYLPNETEGDLGDKPQVPARRRATRPNSPPPPAPIGGPPQAKTNKEKLRSTSWYAECGLFKATDHPLVPPDLSPTSLTPQRNSSTCWYAEVGLYQPKNKSVTSNIETSGKNDNSSSETSGNSSSKDIKNNAQEVKIYSPKPDLIPNSKFYTDSTHSTTQEDLDSYYNIKNQNYYNSDSMKRSSNDKMATLLKDEPLYQFYDAAVIENALNESSSESEYDGYEEIGELLGKVKEEVVKETINSPVRTRLQGCRTLWCEIPEVLQSEILRTLTATHRKLQEAKFEILTSEASYLNSLNVLTDHFIPQLSKDNLTSPEDRKILFGNILDVKQCSEKLLTELESSWQESILLPNICDIIQRYCQEHFAVYVEYCANQTLSDAVLRKCRGETSPKGGKSPNFTRFGEVVKRLEASTACQGLSLHSFLMLPMQRVTRLPLLLDAVLRRLTPSDDDFPSCQSALRALHDLATRCNEAARHTERLCELERLQSQLEFPGGVPVVQLVAEGCKRYLVRSGDLTQLLPRGGAKSDDQGIKLTFGKRFTKQTVTVLLFEDWIIIARRKNEDTLTVLHHCPRSFLELSPPDSPPPTLDSALLLFLTLLENHDGKQISLLLSCSSETEKTRWIEALRPPQTEDPNETIYESWDCPQVQALHNYEAVQPDELSLKRGDVVNVDRKMKDGWYHGNRLRDGQGGWFPGNHTLEIANPHLRARNLRQRYRLLAYTDEFLSGKT